MSGVDASMFDCGLHGRRASAVVCRHHVLPSDRLFGFIENSDDPHDLQAWCEDCERMFLQEGGMTEAFRKFNDFAVVCSACYATIKSRHATL